VVRELDYSCRQEPGLEQRANSSGAPATLMRVKITLLVGALAAIVAVVAHLPAGPEPRSQGRMRDHGASSGAAANTVHAAGTPELGRPLEPHRRGDYALKFIPRTAHGGSEPAAAGTVRLTSAGDGSSVRTVELVGADDGVRFAPADLPLILDVQATGFLRRQLVARLDAGTCRIVDLDTAADAITSGPDDDTALSRAVFDAVSARFLDPGESWSIAPLTMTVERGAAAVVELEPMARVRLLLDTPAGRIVCPDFSCAYSRPIRRGRPAEQIRVRRRDPAGTLDAWTRPAGENGGLYVPVGVIARLGTPGFARPRDDWTIDVRAANRYDVVAQSPLAVCWYRFVTAAGDPIEGVRLTPAAAVPPGGIRAGESSASDDTGLLWAILAIPPEGPATVTVSAPGYAAPAPIGVRPASRESPTLVVLRPSDAVVAGTVRFPPGYDADASGRELRFELTLPPLTTRALTVTPTAAGHFELPFLGPGMRIDCLNRNLVVTPRQSTVETPADTVELSAAPAAELVVHVTNFEEKESATIALMQPGSDDAPVTATRRVSIDDESPRTRVFVGPGPIIIRVASHFGRLAARRIVIDSPAAGPGEMPQTMDVRIELVEPALRDFDLPRHGVRFVVSNSTDLGEILAAESRRRARMARVREFYGDMYARWFPEWSAQQREDRLWARAMDGSRGLLFAWPDAGRIRLPVVDGLETDWHAWIDGVGLVPIDLGPAGGALTLAFDRCGQIRVDVPAGRSVSGLAARVAIRNARASTITRGGSHAFEVEPGDGRIVVIYVPPGTYAVGWSPALRRPAGGVTVFRPPVYAVTAVSAGEVAAVELPALAAAADSDAGLPE
jgi:hypothetical protein